LTVDDKAAVEAGVLSVERWVLAPLRDRRPVGLAELNEAIAERVRWLNDRPFRGLPTSRRELFDDIERAALKPLPAARFELAKWKRATVNIDYHLLTELTLASSLVRGCIRLSAIC
jgi:hypothetical protein